jgi:hypothetical protein
MRAGLKVAGRHCASEYAEAIRRVFVRPDIDLPDIRSFFNSLSGQGRPLRVSAVLLSRLNSAGLRPAGIPYIEYMPDSSAIYSGHGNLAAFKNRRENHAGFEVVLA